MVIQVSSRGINLMNALFGLQMRPGTELKLHYKRCISPDCLVVLESAARRFGNGNLNLQIDPRFNPVQLDQIFNDPKALRRSLRIQAKAFFLGPERTSTEILAEINRAFGRSATKGIYEFNEQADLLEETDYLSCLRQNIITLFVPFKGTTTKTPQELISLLNQVRRLEDHELNNRVVDELLRLDQYDMQYVATAFSVFQQAFPGEPSYFRKAADFYYGQVIDKRNVTLPENLSQAEVSAHFDALRLPSAQSALAAYERLHVLVPAEFEAKAAESSAAQPAKAGKAARRKLTGKKKPKKKKTRSLFAGQQAHMEKIAAAEQRKLEISLVKEIKELWGKAGKEKPDQAIALMIRLSTADSRYFNEVFGAIIADKEERTAHFKKLNYLRDLAEENGFASVANYFHELANMLVAGIIEDIIKGRTFADLAPNFKCGEGGALTVESYCVKSLTLLDKLIRDGEIEELDVALLKGLIRASEDSRNPHQVEAGQTLALMYELTPDHLFLEIYMPQIAKKDPKTYETLSKVLAEAVDSAKKALAIFNHPDLRNTEWRDRLARKLAFPMAMQGSHILLSGLGTQAAAAEKFKEALSIDPECTIALENMCMYAVNVGDCEAAINHGGVLLARYYKTKKIHKMKDDAPPEIQAKFDMQTLKKVSRSVGMAAMRLFEKTHAPEYLEMARVNYEAVFAFEATDRARHSLLGIYFYTKDFDKIIKLAKEVIVGKPEQLSTFMLLIRTLWANAVPKKFSKIPLELIKLINDY
ncbi:MAG: hypothetical protein KKA31_05560, partial [Candidatus Margulisbacteria bacterium]|nr:hypothetical protein [Candidatus Margulisiibacteriota bacterium]